MSAFNPYEDSGERYCANCDGELGSEPHENEDGELICGSCHADEPIETEEE